MNLLDITEADNWAYCTNYQTEVISMTFIKQPEKEEKFADKP